MQKRTNALYRGRVSVRPWRVGVIIETNNADQVARTIKSLSDVWGGAFMPILDARIPEAELLECISRFDLDSAYCELENESLQKILQDNHIAWRGRGRYGPFGADRQLEKGLLPVHHLAGSEKRQDQKLPGGPEHPLAVAAYLGMSTDQQTACIDGAIPKNNGLLELATNHSSPAPYGLAVLRGESPQDAVWFWNCRSLTGAIYPIMTDSLEFNNAVLADINDPAPIVQKFSSTSPDAENGVLPVWGHADLSESEQQHLEDWATARAVTLEARDRSEALTRAWFPGFAEISSKTFRVEAMPTERLIPVEVPSLPVNRDSRPFPGIVAAEVRFNEATGLDPRLTVSLPPHRRFSSLVDRPGFEIEQVRSSEDGPVFGVQADTEEISVKNVYQLDVMRLLFSDTQVQVSQSDEGKFQTRAAELFGGPLSGHLAQPGVRAAIMEVGKRTTGVALNQLHNAIDRSRGEWPDPMRILNPDPKEYVDQQVKALLYSGMLVPSLRIQCHECRVTLDLRPKDLDTVVVCEFCGEDISLALAIALHRPDWRFHLAGHLSADRVKAFLPAMAAFGVLSDLSHAMGPQAPHMFGLEVQHSKHSKVEVDVAMVMPRDGWIVVLGEVKNNKSIDANDVQNLFKLREELANANIVGIPLFATIKDTFDEEERTAIRSAMTSKVLFARRNGTQYPLAPLLLTRRDMSLPRFHDDHPWRWSKPGSGAGLIEIAYQSCVKHLGLSPIKPTPDDGSNFEFDKSIGGNTSS